MMAETDDAFERAADIEYRLRSRRQPGEGSLAYARMAFHSKVNSLLFLSLALAAHWYFVQRVTYWLIAHAVLIGFVFLALVKAWGDQRVADAALRERDRRE